MARRTLQRAQTVFLFYLLTVLRRLVLLARPLRHLRGRRDGLPPRHCGKKRAARE